ncbi:MAG: helicase HerA domain-containing protein [Aureispira sp.]
MINKIEESINNINKDKFIIKAKNWFSELIQDEQYVGDLYSTNYEKAKVLVHDLHRERVGGIPSLCFLIATRINLSEKIDYKRENASIVLLRVMDSTTIPQDKEVEKIRVQTAQRISGVTDKHWDHKDYMDEKTRSVFGFAGLECRIVGTFYLEKNKKQELDLKFGTDLSNFYSNMALKVYKPIGTALETLVNYIDPNSLAKYKQEFGSTSMVALGKIRYASTHRQNQGIDNVATYIYPADLLSQKTALFGMTRTGKSNTTKIIAKSVYELRHPKNQEEEALSIGQVIFDPNGEYANENTQDANDKENPTALKNIWESHCNSDDSQTRLEERKKNIVIYGLYSHSSDSKGQEREIMKLNFYNYNMLANGKSIINMALSDESAQYFKNFRQVEIEKPNQNDYSDNNEFWGELKQYYRKTLTYFTLLNKAGLKPPARLEPKMHLDTDKTKSLFSSKFRAVMSKVEITDKKKEGLIHAAAEILGKKEPNWDSLPSAFEGLFYFLETKDYSEFNVNYIKKDSPTGQGYIDSDLERILEMFKYSKGANLIGKVKPQHDPNSKTDYANEIYEHLLKGKLVIVDQSSGNKKLNESSAERIMDRIFRGNQKVFRKGERPKDIMVYIEEAHNLLPSGNDLDLSNIWVRTAKEGAKYKLGLVYATQEVSSIQKNILKNTANWFISHLNNTDETKELVKYYDFADFEPSIRRAQDKGFLRVKTLSSPFIIPMQIDIFKIEKLDE